MLYVNQCRHIYKEGELQEKATLSKMETVQKERNPLYMKTGEKRVSDGALAALTLLCAVSNPKEKETMINVITNAIK